MAVNPALFGPLPAGVTVIQPYYHLPANGGSLVDYLFATSIGLDRPMVDILTAIRLALDPSGRILTWGGSNPCMPFNGQSIDQQVCARDGSRPCASVCLWENASRTALAPARCADIAPTRRSCRVSQAGSASYGQGWNGVACRDAYITSREGGIESLWLSGFSANATRTLTGTLPVELRELRTASSIVLSGFQLSGAIPQCWGANYSRTFYPQHPGFDRVTTLAFNNNAGLTGALPAALGAGMVNGATIVLNNLQAGVVSLLPATLAFKSVVIAGSQGIYGAVPRNVTVRQGPSFNGQVGQFLGTSIGQATDMRAALLAIRAGLDTGSALRSWNSTLHPCQWVGVVCGDAPAAGGGVTALLLDSKGLAGTIACDILRLTNLRTLW